MDSSSPQKIGVSNGRRFLEWPFWKKGLSSRIMRVSKYPVLTTPFSLWRLYMQYWRPVSTSVWKDTGLSLEAKLWGEVDSHCVCMEPKGGFIHDIYMWLYVIAWDQVSTYIWRWIWKRWSQRNQLPQGLSLSLQLPTINWWTQQAKTERAEPWALLVHQGLLVLVAYHATWYVHCRYASLAS
jgi:hypothetical protein